MIAVDATCTNCGAPFRWTTGGPRLCIKCFTDVPSVVAIDIDGVLADFVDAFVRTAKSVGLPAWAVDRTQMNSWHWMEEVFGWSKTNLSEIWAAVDATPNWWMTIPPMVSTGDIVKLNMLIARRKVVFITNRRDGTGFSVGKQSWLWLESIGINVPPASVYAVNEDKGDLAKSLGVNIAIDDRNSNLDDYKRVGIKAVCLDWPYNRDWVGDRVSSIGGFIEKLGYAS